MRFMLSDEQSAIQDMAREVLAAESTFDRVRSAGEERQYDSELWALQRSMGWPGVGVPQRWGGQGLGLVELSVIAEECGYACSSTPLLGTILAATSLVSAASSEQCERYLPSLATGEVRGAVALTADSTPVPDAGEAGLIVVLEGSGGRVSLQPAQPVETIDPTLRYGRVVDPSAGEPLNQSPIAYDSTLVVVAAHQLGLAQRALDLSVAYTSVREQFGVPVATFQAVSHRLAQAHVDLTAARSLVYHAAWAVQVGDSEASASAARAKAWLAEASRTVTGSAIHAHGGIGFTWEANLHWLFKRATMLGPYLGGARQHRSRLLEMLGTAQTTSHETDHS